MVLQALSQAGGCAVSESAGQGEPGRVPGAGRQAPAEGREPQRVPDVGGDRRGLAQVRRLRGEKALSLVPSQPLCGRGVANQNVQRDGVDEAVKHRVVAPLNVREYQRTLHFVMTSRAQDKE